LKILSAIQEIIINKPINNIVYQDGLVFKKYKSDLYKKLNIDYWSAIPPPPLNNSKQTTTDLTEVLSLANNRISSEIDLVLKADKNPMLLFNNYISSKNIVFPYDQFKEIYTFLTEIILDLKYYYNRARPKQLAKFYHLDIDVIHTDTHATPSYPSGHTAYAALVASILTDMYPKDEKVIWGIVDMCGLARMLQGVHFRGDNDASILLVKKIYNRLKEINKKFNK
jgi:hypothetical protein